MMIRRIIFILFFLIANTVWAAEPSEDKFVYDDHGRRDPFWKLVTSGGGIVNFETDFLVSDLTLEGIIFDPTGKSLAIINGNVVKQNDKLGLFIISKIEKDKVILLKGQESFALELKKEE